MFVDGCLWMRGNLLWDHTPVDLSGPEQGRGAVGLRKEEWEAGAGLARNRRTRALSLPACLPGGCWGLLQLSSFWELSIVISKVPFAGPMGVKCLSLPISEKARV